MLEETKERLYVMASFDILETFRKELETLVQNGKKVVLISDDFEIPKAIYHKTQTEKNQIRLIVDSSFVLTGEISGSEHDTCLYSGQQNLVDVPEIFRFSRVLLSNMRAVNRWVDYLTWKKVVIFIQDFRILPMIMLQQKSVN